MIGQIERSKLGQIEFTQRTTSSTFVRKNYENFTAVKLIHGKSCIFMYIRIKLKLHLISDVKNILESTFLRWYRVEKIAKTSNDSDIKPPKRKDATKWKKGIKIMLRNFLALFG